MAETTSRAEVGRAAGGGRRRPARLGIDPNAVYSLGSSSSESERLQRQADELATESRALLDRVELGPGGSALDLGCGPRGVIELLEPGCRPGGR